MLQGGLEDGERRVGLCLVVIHMFLFDLLVPLVGTLSWH